MSENPLVAMSYGSYAAYTNIALTSALVLEMHHPHDDGFGPVCCECAQVWPCRTAKTIAGISDVKSLLDALAYEDDIEEDDDDEPE